MKKLFLAVALLATSLVASAQHASFYVSYHSLGVGEYADWLDDIDADNENLNGFSIGFNKAFSISSSVPLFIEVGAGLTYAWAKYFEDMDILSGECIAGGYYYDEWYDEYYYYGCGGEWDVTASVVAHHLMVNVPVNFMYKIKFPNSSITLEPYVGLNLRGHILGKEVAKFDYNACCNDMDDALEDGLDEIDEEDYNQDYFDKKDMGGKKYVANRFNIGWQIGANVDFGPAFVGVSYGSDFNKYAKWNGEEFKFNALNVTVGVRF